MMGDENPKKLEDALGVIRRWCALVAFDRERIAELMPQLPYDVNELLDGFIAVREGDRFSGRQSLVWLSRDDADAMKREVAGGNGPGFSSLWRVRTLMELVG